MAIRCRTLVARVSSGRCFNRSGFARVLQVFGKCVGLVERRIRGHR